MSWDLLGDRFWATELLPDPRDACCLQSCQFPCPQAWYIKKRWSAQPVGMDRGILGEKGSAVKGIINSLSHSTDTYLVSTVLFLVRITFMAKTTPQI